MELMTGDNYKRPLDIVLEGLRREGFSSDELSMKTLYAYEKIVARIMGEQVTILTRLRNYLPSVIRNTPHSCQTDEHCCALHAAHRAAAEKVEGLLQNEIDKLNGKYCPPLPEVPDDSLQL